MGDEMRVEGPKLPPVVGRGQPGQQPAMLKFMQANPGLWCRLAERDVAAGRRKSLMERASRYRKLPKFVGCEFAVRTVDGKAVLFGRYTPSQQG